MNAISTQLRDPMNSGLTRWRMAVLYKKWTPPRNSGGIPQVSSRFSLSTEMSRLTRDGTAEPVLRDQILRHERGQRNIHFSCSADHVQDWQPYPVDPYSCYMCDRTDRDLLNQKPRRGMLLTVLDLEINSSSPLSLI